MKPQRAQHLVRLVDANPNWVDYDFSDGFDKPGKRKKVAVAFDCPIHEHCRISVPLHKPLDGGPPIRDWFKSGALWAHSGTDFVTLSLSPSIHVLGEPDDCEWHGFVRNGTFSTCGDSR